MKEDSFHADADILIVGAGACGLTAALQLTKGGKKVIVLEGRNRLGGRIHTIHDSAFSEPVEAGAEFIHGKLPITLSMLNEYGIFYYPVKGDFWQVQNEQLDHENNFIDEHHRLLIKYLEDLKVDMSVENFLNMYFPDEKYSWLKNSIRKFVEGYDAGDPSRASVFAFRDEWMNDDEQYRVAGGYGKLVEALAKDCSRHGCIIHTSSAVKSIRWQPHQVAVATGKGDYFTSKVAIITVPPPVLLASGSENSIAFSPPLPEQMEAFRKIGYGGVIKILLQFRHAFWKDEEVANRTGKNLKNLAFIFSNEVIPTWWTQSPGESPLLTGWLGGPDAKKHADDKILLEEALKSLSSIFHISYSALSENLAAWQVHNWMHDPFSAGAYSYDTVDGKRIKKILNEPVANTLFFAGEALQSGTDGGTVEGALKSGFDVAGKILGN